jgi:hypothetical protein
MPTDEDILLAGFTECLMLQKIKSLKNQETAAI